MAWLDCHHQQIKPTSAFITLQLQHEGKGILSMVMANAGPNTNAPLTHPGWIEITVFLEKQLMAWT
eukprot:scaffold85895_cov77-Cyclotella_meneghiniana.AAC.1